MWFFYDKPKIPTCHKNDINVNTGCAHTVDVARNGRHLSLVFACLEVKIFAHEITRMNTYNLVDIGVWIWRSMGGNINWKEEITFFQTFYISGFFHQTYRHSNIKLNMPRRSIQQSKLCFKLGVRINFFAAKAFKRNRALLKLSVHERISLLFISLGLNRAKHKESVVLLETVCLIPDTTFAK